MEQLEKFRQQIEQINYTSPQTIILNSVISLEEVRAIEIKLGVSFPEEYRQFITFIGDGGIINSSKYGCCTLQSLGKYESEGIHSRVLKILPIMSSPNLLIFQAFRKFFPLITELLVMNSHCILY